MLAGPPSRCQSRKLVFITRSMSDLSPAFMVILYTLDDSDCGSAQPRDIHDTTVRVCAICVLTLGHGRRLARRTTGDAPNESRIPCHDPSDRTVADIPLKQEPDKERRGR